MESLIFKDCNFSDETLRIINLYPPLAEWFKKNQFALSYYGLTKPNFDFENKQHYTMDITILKKMADISLTWIGSKYQYSDQEKALKAAAAIYKIYSRYCGELNDQSRVNYIIDLGLINDSHVSKFDSSFMEDVLNPPDLADFELSYLENKRNELIQQMSQVEQRIANLKSNSHQK